MFETLKRLYLEGKIDEVKLDNAVNKGWITVEQKLKIIA
jgi:hypothetical protein